MIVYCVHNWFVNLLPVLSSVNPFVRICWLRTMCGGWTTSIRMHQEVAFECCFFGCVHCEDCLSHYLSCPYLWSLARESSSVSELDPSVSARLSLTNPHKDQLILFSFCHSLYHMCINDKDCRELHFAHRWPTLQRRALSFGRQIRQQIR